MVVIAVVGTASRSLPPERGTVRLRVEGEGSTAREAVDPLRPVLARVAAEARAFEAAGSATRWSAASIATSVQERYRGSEEAPRRVHVASAPVSVRFRDLEALRRWVGALLDEALVHVDGIDWTLTDATRTGVERDLRAEAARDAAERAGDYAAALGVPEVRVARVWEDGLRREDGGGVFMTKALTGAAGDDVDLHPAPVEALVRLTAEFESPTAAG